MRDNCTLTSTYDGLTWHKQKGRGGKKEGLVTEHASISQWNMLF